MFVKAIGPAVKSDGTKVPYEIGKGYNLGAGTYYIDASLPDAPYVTVHISWDAAVVATGITYEVSNMPAFASISEPYTDNSAPTDVSINTVDTAGLWLPVTFPVAPAAVGGTASTTGVTVAGGTAGAAILIDPNNAFRRTRTKVVTTTGGFFRQHTSGKGA